MAANDVSITIKVPPKAHQRLHEIGKTKGYSASAYAQMLFDAGFAARLGQMRGDPVSDAELDEQVKLVFALAGQGNAAAISKATGVKEVLVTKILNAWKKQGKRS
ncbi:hypothetical protein [Allomesorhizobium alhagi]|uniref:Uncharacterized protein n=1 Tax=Mesorhizobium alhagi CCNWXJ12-2 TaxID=1107882 RepID=H0HQX3_9HYPH|nr:hypothetical protein [Mesorhizobium alhagi]EHK56835.1 hypothetical protein MAXJ12_12777 [Mesorhizobium alhagi CCNWXJ12-2]